MNSPQCAFDAVKLLSQLSPAEKADAIRSGSDKEKASWLNNRGTLAAMKIEKKIPLKIFENQNQRVTFANYQTSLLHLRHSLVVLVVFSTWGFLT